MPIYSYYQKEILTIYITLLQSVCSAKYHCVDISSNLSWDTHIDYDLMCMYFSCVPHNSAQRGQTIVGKVFSFSSLSVVDLFFIVPFQRSQLIKLSMSIKNAGKQRSKLIIYGIKTKILQMKTLTGNKHNIKHRFVTETNGRPDTFL